jgi:pimeloyl-ACP methyl ester carboxylesterase
MGSWNHWTRNLDALAGRFRVHAVDLPGFGDSYPVPKSMGQIEYVDHVLQGIGPIVGTQPFRLAAFSFGAVVAAKTAARLGEQVSRLSLIGAGGFGHVETLAMRPIPDESAGDAVRREALRFNLCALMLADPASVTEESLTYYADNFRTTRYDGRHFSMSRSVIEALDQIRCPLQFIFGVLSGYARRQCSHGVPHCRAHTASERMRAVTGQASRSSTHARSICSTSIRTANGA